MAKSVVLDAFWLIKNTQKSISAGTPLAYTAPPDLLVDGQGASCPTSPRASSPSALTTVNHVNYTVISNQIRRCLSDKNPARQTVCCQDEWNSLTHSFSSTHSKHIFSSLLLTYDPLIDICNAQSICFMHDWALETWLVLHQAAILYYFQHGHIRSVLYQLLSHSQS